MYIFQLIQNPKTSDQLRTYYIEEVSKMVSWTFIFKNRFSYFEIGEIIQKAFKDMCVQTNLGDVTNEAQSIGFRFIYDVPIGKEILQGWPQENTTYVLLNKKENNKFLLFIPVNFFSDFPRNKKTGELVDLSAFAYKNRERLDKSMRTLEKLVGGEIIDWSPRVGKYLKHWSDFAKKSSDWDAEEVYKYGYLPLTERKAEYEAQEKKKNSITNKISNLFKKKV
ncbi:MAG: hypothetical protein WCO06_02885 [Candidatus Roizmanbacteria bacterium]